MKTILHKFFIVSLSIFLFVSVSSCIHETNQDYRQELDVVSEISEYKNIIKDQPEHALVDLELMIPDIVLDIRYATLNNFTHQVIYTQPKAYVRKPVADALVKIQSALKSQGLGLKIFDAYRPYAATVKFYDVYPDTNFVAAPWKGSVHNRGCAVDLTLIDLASKKELEMPTPFDDFTEKASHTFMDLPESAIENRELLRKIMVENGFETYTYEWWHYNYQDWANYKLMDISFEDI